MIDKRFIIDDINDFLKPNNYQWKTYFDKAECRAILDAIEKSYKYEKIAKAWEEILNELEEVKVAYYQDSAFITSNAIQLVIDFINQKLAEVEE